MPDELFDPLTFYFSRKLRKRFKSGELPRQWRKEYPQLFNDHDLSLTKRGKSYLFFEWLAAVMLLHSTGYRSHHKFECANHEEKYATFCRLASHKFQKAFFKNCTGSPDLLVVAPDADDWFFCEVKGPRDRIGPHQRRIARVVHKHTGRKVVLLTFEAVD